MEDRIDCKPKNNRLDIALFSIFIIIYLVASFYSIHAIFHSAFLSTRFYLTIIYLLFWIFLICFYCIRRDLKKIKMYLVFWGITIIGNLMMALLEIFPSNLDSLYDTYNWIAFIVWGIFAAPLYGIVYIAEKNFPLFEMSILAFALLLVNLVFYLWYKKSPKTENR